MLACTVLPTYNERGNIRALIEGLLEHVAPPYMVLVVDDDSPDRTWELVEELAEEHNTDGGPPRVVLHRRTTERGLTSAIQCGIDRAAADHGAQVVTWMDCDLSMPPADVPKLVECVRQGADLAVGSRWAAGGADVAHGRMHYGLSRLINLFATLCLGRTVTDYTSGFVAARTALLTQFRLQGDYGEYCVDLLTRAVRSGARVVELPYTCVPRNAGDSKTGAGLWDYLTKGRKYVTTILRLCLRRSP